MSILILGSRPRRLGTKAGNPGDEAIMQLHCSPRVVGAASAALDLGCFRRQTRGELL